MKLLRSLFIVLLLLAISSQSCKKSKSSVIEGEQSPMGVVGTTVQVSTGNVAGVSNITGSVTELEDGISTFTASATITNSRIKTLLANFPEFTISGNNVSISELKFKITDQGYQAVNVLDPGVLVNYNSNVGDTYPIAGTNSSRTVVSKSTVDDYSWGYMDIKVSVVEENPNKLGVKKIKYIANHRWGLVAIVITFDDNTELNFGLFSSTNN
ncbi:MAG: hypothetical protein KKG99_09585 [Bacteroidetes bacterium]|nr:hypothetical protein [Bacteroidota bacterium]